ncbi:MAG: hypothetical protein ACRDHW_03070, partial [Ktedonobacteraceae bacterium]
AEIDDYKEYMGIGSQSTQALTAGDNHTLDELDAMLATNPYASIEVVDEKYTHLLAAIRGDEWDDEEEEEEDEMFSSKGGYVRAIIAENPRLRLDMAENFQPDANALAATGVAVFAMSGQGKTEVVMRFVEQYVKGYHTGCTIFDSQGDALSLVEDGFFPNGHIATPGNVPSMESVIKYGLQVVFDLSEWHKPGKVGMDREMAGAVIAETINDLMIAQKHTPPQSRRTCLVVLDETQLWVPQGRTPGGMTQATAGELYNAALGLSTTGRKLGLMPFFAGPRIATIHNDIIANCETRIFGKADLDNDLSRYHEYFSKDIASDMDIRSLGPGQMIVCTGGKKLFTQFKERTTRHVSSTPSVMQDLDRYSQKLPREMLTMLSRQSNPNIEVPSTPRPGYATGYTGAASQREETIEELLYADEEEEEVSVEDRLNQDERLVLDAYRDGKRTGNAIAAVTGLSGTRVNKCLNSLAFKGLIDWKPKVTA